MIEILIEKGADINRKNNNDELPFMVALKKGKISKTEWYYSNRVRSNLFLPFHTKKVNSNSSQSSPVQSNDIIH